MYKIVYTTTAGDKRVETLATTQQLLDSLYILDMHAAVYSILIKLKDGSFVDITAQ